MQKGPVMPRCLHSMASSHSYKASCGPRETAGPWVTLYHCLSTQESLGWVGQETTGLIHSLEMVSVF